MKDLSKPLTWFFTFLNIGVYNLSDSIDSLVIRLKFIGLKKQAETIATLTETIEYQQGIIILLDAFKCLFMLLSLVFLFLSNLETILKSFRWIRRKTRSTCHFIRQLFLKIYHFFKTLFFKTISFFKTLFKIKP